MKNCRFFSALVIVGIIMITSCSASDSENSSSDTIIATGSDSVEPDTIEAGTWIYFSQNTFPHDDFTRGMKSPYLIRRLQAEEIRLLDSILLAEVRDTVERIKVSMCFWPKHGVLIRDSIGVERIVNISFTCDKSNSEDNLLKRVPVENWQVLFKRVGLPTDSGLEEFFQRGYLDSAFRSQLEVFYWQQ